jgi:thioredoxin 1
LLKIVSAFIMTTNRQPYCFGDGGEEPTRQALDQLRGPVVLEFGAGWCHFCQALEPQLTALLERYPSLRHIKIEDGKGKPLGRSFQVKLWPTLILRRHGLTLQRLVRPQIAEVEEALKSLMISG